MKSLITYITNKSGALLNEKQNFLIKGHTIKQDKLKYFPKTTEELQQLIKDRIKKEGNNCDLNDIDVSKITDMSHLFETSQFNGDISKWDVSNVTHMTSMFENSQFNGDISKWDVSNVKTMNDMFKDSPLEGNEPKWYKNKYVFMKTITEYIAEKQNFLIKGHTKDQSDTVDLDLPSGTKWATCNIGANKPEESGLLFEFGRVDGYKYKDTNHKFLSANDYVTTSGTKYKKGDTLKPEDDAAYQTTNGRFRMPTADEIDELLKHTDNEWTELNGVKGRKFISKENESKWIFIPAAGDFDVSFYNAGHFGYVWSASVDSNNSDGAYYLYFYKDNCFRGFSYSHSLGCSVRGVLNK